MSIDVRAVPGLYGSIVTQFVTHPRPVFVWHPVDLATPDRAAARGRPSMQPPADFVQLRPRDVVW
ncbi:hypothetical protein EV378_2988 [Pseudonocardia endophytica]|uniref:Uncharacterized protein n=1 Tax=Pseudonocardia endophytica TaxID=401976 RepID=A0A4R1I3N3_PSEEN|nr:hypothetical protein EV378_2988 [Pseudonocardia endophytica]